MKTLTIIIITVFTYSISYSQELETLGAGVINFLLKNPSTANQTNATEAAALKTIGNLLSISAHRKHEMNVANAGRSEIVFNTTSGSQATIYSDKEGNLYLLFNGEIIPISSGLVSQARGEVTESKIINSTLAGYNIAGLRNEYVFEKEEPKELYYNLKAEEETVEEIAKKNNISPDDIYIKGKHTRWTGAFGKPVSYYSLHSLKHINCKKFKKIKNKPGYSFACSGKEWKKTGCRACNNGHFFIKLKVHRFQHAIITTFTCNWKKDFDGKGLDFDDFQGIKRSFYEDEKMMFVLGYTTETHGTWSLEVYEALTGTTVYKKNGTADKGGQVISFEKDGEKLKPGVYMYNFILMAEGEDILSKSEKFEIIIAGEK